MFSTELRKVSGITGTPRALVCPSGQRCVAAVGARRVFHHWVSEEDEGECE